MWIISLHNTGSQRKLLAYSRISIGVPESGAVASYKRTDGNNGNSLEAGSQVTFYQWSFRQYIQQC